MSYTALVKFKALYYKKNIINLFCLRGVLLYDLCTIKKKNNGLVSNSFEIQNKQSSHLMRGHCLLKFTIK